jgi:hypothetical protein
MSIVIHIIPDRVGFIDRHASFFPFFTVWIALGVTTQQVDNQFDLILQGFLLNLLLLWALS